MRGSPKKRGKEERPLEVLKVSMKPEKLEQFRVMLTQKINDLLEDAGKTVSEMTSGGKENFPDPTTGIS